MLAAIRHASSAWLSSGGWAQGIAKRERISWVTD
jgi:hypothetical protein